MGHRPSPLVFCLFESGTPPKGLDASHPAPTEVLCMSLHASGGWEGMAIEALNRRAESCEQKVEEREPGPLSCRGGWSGGG